MNRRILTLLIIVTTVLCAFATSTSPVSARETAPEEPAPEPVTPKPVTCRGKIATIVGTPGDDVLLGTPGDDVIVAGRGDDSVFGGAGNDVICGNGGADQLWGEDGRDQLLGGGGADTLVGGPQRDRLRGGPGPDRCEAPFPGERRHHSCNDQVQATQDDLPAARNLLEASRAKWNTWLADLDTDDYGFDTSLSCECDDGNASIDVLDGTAYWRNLTGSLLGDRTLFKVDDLFNRADAILDDLEEDLSIVGDPDTGVGRFFTLRVDRGTGFPYLVGDNGPADGGVDYLSRPRSVFQGTLSNVDNGFASYTLDMLALANPNPEFDELISVVGTGFEDDFDPQVVTEHGEPCLGVSAEDSTTCLADLANLVDELTIEGDQLIEWECGFCLPTIVFMIARSGSDLQVISPSNWLEALGTIDTAAEVPFALQSRAHVKPRRNGSYLALTSTFLAECDPIVRRQVLSRVTLAGEVSGVRTAYSVEYRICF